MKFIKNNLKFIIGFVLGAILTGGIVYAAVSASEVSYTTDINANIKNVGDALNDLYSKSINANTTQSITKTLLWENENPTSAFAIQDITLSSPYTNYTHILVQWKSLKSSSTIYEDIFKLSPDRKGQLEQARFSLTAFNSDGNAVYNRRLDCVQDSSSKLSVTNSSKVNNSGNDNDRCIPIAIYGLNL